MTTVVEEAMAAASSQPGSPPNLLNWANRLRPKKPRPKVTASSRARAAVIL